MKQSHLLQPAFLNGTTTNSSVWTALDALVPPVSIANALVAPGSATTTLLSFPFFRSTGEKKEEKGEEHTILDDGSICVSVPLSHSPGSDAASEVSVVPHTVELVDVEFDETGAVRPVPTPPEENAGRPRSDDGGRWWNLGWGKGGEEPEKGKKLKKAQKAKVAKKIFYPPKDRVSVRCSWWGYELFIPEDIFRKLDSGIEPVATALQSLAAGLTLLATNLPTALSALPGGLLLKSLLPLLSVIVASLTWYWKTVKAKDRGDGVILAATWVLPVAVVPRTLERGRWPAPASEGGEAGGASPAGGMGEEGEKEAVVGVERQENPEKGARTAQRETAPAAQEHGRKKSVGGLKRVLSLTKRG
ncbi:hypothetical protein JCM6882_001718 [Rhodosporidiobolus microsporus]